MNTKSDNTLVSTEGVIYEKSVNKLEQEIMDYGLSLAEEADFINRLKYEVSKRSKEIREGKAKDKLTVNDFFVIMEDTRLDRFFANFGSSLEQFAEDYGFDVEEVRAKGFFNKDKDLIVNGRTFRFHVSHDDNVYVQIL